MRVRYTGESSTRLTRGYVYTVLGIEAGNYRLLNNEADPCLYTPEDFEIVNSETPTFWIESSGCDGERYAYPAAWNRNGFFEDYHDGQKEAFETFWREYERLFHSSSHSR